jgi:hypothetical protein
MPLSNRCRHGLATATKARRKPDGIFFGRGGTSVTLHNTWNIFGGEAAAVYVKIRQAGGLFDNHRLI